MPMVLTGSGGYGVPTSMTAVTSTSGTSIDFTSIPSGVKRITVMTSAVSTNGGSFLQIQVGAGSVTTTGYSSTGSVYGGTNTTTGTSSSTGLLFGGGSSGDSINGLGILCLVTGNTWAWSSNTTRTSGNYLFAAGGTIALGGTLDRVRITTVNGTDTFDAGTINIQYE